MIWRRAWWITRNSLRRSKGGFLLSIVFNIYFGVIIGLTVSDMVNISREELIWRDTFLADGLMFICVSVMGFVMTKDYRTYWSTDSFSRRLVFLRVMPIRVEEIVLSRFQLMVVSIILLCPMYFLPLYFVSDLREHLNVLEYFEWAITWMCISTMVGGFYVYVEQGATGKRYLIASVVISMFFLFGAVAIGLTGFSVFLTTIDLVKEYGLLVPIVSLILTFVVSIGWMKVCERRIRMRDYAR